MAEREPTPKVALYWDFENFHAILGNLEYGEQWYRENRFTPQPPLIDLSPIIEYAASLGDITINRAYGNWQWFANYRHQLNIAGIDLIQMFPRGQNMKNSADIRMALDALSDVHTHGHLTHVVMVSSDSDFISLAQKVKQSGRFIAGVGVEGFSNRFLVAACNEFKFYHHLFAAAAAERAEERMSPPASMPASMPESTPASMPASSLGLGAESSAAPTREEAQQALHRALRQCVERRGENYVPSSTVKQVLVRLMPAFDERALGFGSFTGFMAQFPELLRFVDHEAGGHVALVREEWRPAAAPVAPLPADEST